MAERTATSVPVFKPDDLRFFSLYSAMWTESFQVEERCFFLIHTMVLCGLG